jgi:hypothetical protein
MPNLAIVVLVMFTSPVGENCEDFIKIYLGVKCNFKSKKEKKKRRKEV